MKMAKANKKPQDENTLRFFIPRSGVRLSLPFGFRPVALRRRLSVVLPFLRLAKFTEICYILKLNRDIPPFRTITFERL